MFIASSVAARRRSQNFRDKFLCGSILGAGALLAPCGAWAQTYTTTQTGIAVTATGATPINVTTTGSASVTTSGINLTQTGTGAISANISGAVNTVAGQNSNRGILLFAGTGAVTLTNAGAVTAAGDGVHALSAAANVTISGSGSITAGATGIVGYFAGNPVATVRIDYAGAVSASGNGVFANAGSAGTAIIVNSTNVASTNGAAVVGAGKAVQVTTAANAVISGKAQGIYATTAAASGTSAQVTVASGSVVSGSTSSGILALGGADSSVVSDGSVQGLDGIQASNQGGTGTVTVSGSGSATGAGVGNAGILAAIGNGQLSISGAGSVSGAYGIRAQVSGTANVSISRSGAISATTNHGISVENAGTGSTQISGIGAVTSTSGAAINVAGANGALTTAGAVNIGGASGLTNAVRGATGLNIAGTNTINVVTGLGGSITGTSGAGVNTSTTNAATNLVFDAAVNGSTFGVNAVATGSGAIAVSGAGAVTGGSSAALNASSASGAVTISGTGAVTSSKAAGIIAAISNAAATSDISITRSGAVSAGATGITADNRGSGAINILTAGSITTSGAVGIVAAGSSGRTSIRGSGDVTSSGVGIYAYFTAGGAVSLDYSGKVRSVTGQGVLVLPGTNGSATVNVSNVQGRSGVFVQGGKSVAVNLAQGGFVAGAGGIAANQASFGIVARTDVGAGRTTSVTTSVGSLVKSENADGILAESGENTTVVANGLVQSGSRGLVATNQSGAGAVSVSGSGDVSGENSIGLYAQVGSGQLSVSGTGRVSGAQGIRAEVRNGDTAMSITRSGAITGTVYEGIAVMNTYGGSTTIAGIGAVSAAQVGIAVGGTDLKGVSFSPVGTTGSAVDIGGDTGLTNSVSGGKAGISVAGTNSIKITTAAGGVITSSTDAGVVTSNVDATTAIKLGDAVAGGTYGVEASSTGTGEITVDVLAAARITGGTAAIQTTSKDGATAINIAGQVGSTSQGIGVKAASTGTGATNIDILPGAALRGSVYALDLATKDGAINVRRAGEISGSVRGAITGAGSIVFNNLTDLTLAGTTSYTGLTTFANSAKVAVGQDASLLAGTFINKSGATLTGTGRLGDVTAESGSIIRPGDRTLAAVGGVPAIGILRVGALNLAAGSTVDIRADASGVSDKIVASGAASLNGATLSITATPAAASAAEQFKWSPGKTYTMLEAASVAGKFNLQTDLVFLTPTAAYRDTGVDVTLARNSVTFDSVAVTPTQQTVGAAIQSQQSTATGAGKELVVALANLTETQAQDALEKLSGKSAVVGAAAPTVMSSTFAGAVSTQATGAVPAMRDGAPSGASFSGGDMPAMGFAGDTPVQSAAAEPFKQVKANVVTPVKTWRLWTSVFGSTSQLFARSAENLQGAMYHQWGGAVGFETMLADNFAGGVALSGMSGPFSVGKGASKGESSGGQVAVYGAFDVGRNYLMASVSYGRFRTDATRSVEIPGTPAERLSNRTPSGVAGVQLEAGRRFDLDVVEATPFVGFQPSLTHASASAEKSSAANSLYGLTYAASDTVSLPVLAGLQVKRGFAMEQGWSGSLEARGGLVHEFRPSRSTRAAFTVLPGSDFVSIGPSAALNTARLSSAITATDNRGLTLSARIGGDFSTSMRSMRIEGGVKYDW